MKLIVRTPGMVPYEPCWQAMQAFTAARAGGVDDELWAVEHPPVFTLGRAAKREHLLAPGDIPVVASDRGGQVTYHGPGQLVVYTLLDVRRLGIGPRELVRRIEQGIIDFLDTLVKPLFSKRAANVRIGDSNKYLAIKIFGQARERYIVADYGGRSKSLNHCKERKSKSNGESTASQHM